ncbi:hypothetical protein [Sphingobium sp. EM0848]|uniref:hypothetical protein n=1 Tax=Sphingobium sp. EM0848 TaxID=2743473 RepID=UPI00159C562C|nr:hypothetical protein [Sphingobium sp. EM0848]
MRQENGTDDERAYFALALVEQCVRTSCLEDLHSGVTPSSATGDYSDVKVVTPYGEIPWNDLSRISDVEMKGLMIEVTNRVFTFLTHAEHLLELGPAARWNRPEHDPNLLKTAQRRATLRK